MHIHVLGSGAGGGFPQWNCNCHNCARIRTGAMRGQTRTQSSIAVSANGFDWILFNASPDIRAQFTAFPAMQPGRAVRDTALNAIILIDAQIDHSTGLILLREHQRPLEIYCTELVQQDLCSGYPLLNLLEHYCGLNWHPIGLFDGDASTWDESAAFTIPGAEGLLFTAIPLTSEAPPYSPRRHQPGPGDNIGVRITDVATGKNLFYAPGLGVPEPRVISFMEDSDCLLVDGTVWTDDELIAAGISDKCAAEMGHRQLGGDDGLVALIAPMERPRKIFIHINNTNPILDESSSERACVEQAGIEVATDGLEIIL